MLRRRHVEKLPPAPTRKKFDCLWTIIIEGASMKISPIVLAPIVIILLIDLYFVMPALTKSAKGIIAHKSASEASIKPILVICADGYQFTFMSRDVPHKMDTGDSIIDETDAVKLSFPDGSARILLHTISAFGAKYEADGLVWWTKGNEGFLEENDVITHRECTFVPQK
jgi:hypothetical protein